MSSTAKTAVKGFTFVEVMIATVIVGIVALFGVKTFQNVSLSRSHGEAREVITEVESPTRLAIFRSMRNWFADPARPPGATVCDPAGPPPYPSLRQAIDGSFVPGLTVEIIRAGGINVPPEWLLPLPKDPGDQRFRQALTSRCFNSPLASEAIDSAYFSTNPQSGIHFCVRLIPKNDGTSSASRALYLADRLMMEGTYITYNFNNGPANGTLPCDQIRPLLAPNPNPPIGPAAQTAPVMGALYYTFYWTSKLPGGNTFSRQINGILMLGGAFDPD